ncbi:MAG: hypothetical protein ACREPM_07315 [Gemmatimonadaceae bacterium]
MKQTRAILMKRIGLVSLVVAIVASPVHGVRGQIAVLSDAVVERSTAPGESYQGQLLVKNMTSTTQEARIYQTDFTFAADGRTGYGTPGTAPRSNAKWVALGASYVEIPAGATVPVNYTVSVPADSSLKGSYWSMVMVEAIAEGAPESRAPNARVQVGLAIATRYGTQIATNIGASGVSRLAFDSLTATTTAKGTQGLRFDFINTGERANRFVLSLELYNEAGELVKKASQSRGLLYPGTGARQLFDVGTVPHGAYTAVLVADGGGDRVFGGQFKIDY